MKQELRRRKQISNGTVTGTEQLLNGVKSLIFRGNVLESYLLHSWLAWKMGDTTRQASTVSGGTLAYLCGQAEDLLNQLLRLRRLF